MQVMFLQDVVTEESLPLSFQYVKVFTVLNNKLASNKYCKNLMKLILSVYDYKHVMRMASIAVMLLPFNSLNINEFVH